MQMRPLGRSGLQTAPLVLGGNVFGWTADEATSFAVLDAFVDSGFSCIDTADVYSRWAPGHSGGESEATIGRWLKQSGKRDRVLIATKVGKPMGDEASEEGRGRQGLSRRWIRQAVHDSLQRLQTDRIDLYQSHDDDSDTPLEDTLAAFGELIAEGKVRAIGASNYGAARLAEAIATSERLGLPRYETLQPHFNLVERQVYEEALEPVCVKHGLGVINFFGLAKGFLTGKYRSEADLKKSPRGDGVKQYLNERGTKILAALDAVAQAHSATTAQVALAWQIGRDSISAPIASATSVAQWQELAGAASLVLTSADRQSLDAASDWR
ncbi:MAG: aldo/keto reductase [Pseudomonadota bacterium]|nr:aldo/keto reductase [Pseudomonadota bacterium]